MAKRLNAPVSKTGIFAGSNPALPALKILVGCDNMEILELSSEESINHTMNNGTYEARYWGKLVMDQFNICYCAEDGSQMWTIANFMAGLPESLQRLADEMKFFIKAYIRGLIDPVAVKGRRFTDNVIKLKQYFDTPEIMKIIETAKEELSS